jgi:hypothetical protein
MLPEEPMSDRAFALTATLVLASLSLACGEKGDGTNDETGGATGSGGTFSSGGSGGSGTGGSGGASEPMRLFGFDTTDEGFAFEPYTPDDPKYMNVGPNGTLAWDDGAGSDDAPGRLKLDVPYDAYSQLADIQYNYDGANPQDWSGKTLRAKVMLESGFSPDESAPGGAYLFMKTTSAYVWAKGMAPNLLPSAAGTWLTLAFDLTAPLEMKPGFDATQVLSFGIQFYTGDPAPALLPDLPPPTPAVIYVDEFTLQ